MTKEQEIMRFLHEKVFDPILESKDAPVKIKSGVTLTIARMEKLDASKMVHFFWSAITGTERSINFSNLMKDAGFNRFEDVLEEFRVRFNDEWLRGQH